MKQSDEISNWNAKLKSVFDNAAGYDVLERILGLLEWHTGNAKAQEFFIMVCTACPEAAKELIDRMHRAAQRRIVEQIEREKTEGARR